MYIRDFTTDGSNWHSHFATVPVAATDADLVLEKWERDGKALDRLAGSLHGLRHGWKLDLHAN